MRVTMRAANVRLCFYRFSVVVKLLSTGRVGVGHKVYDAEELGRAQVGWSGKG